MTALQHFFYVSRADDDTTHDDVAAILQVSQARNAALGLTGALLFTGSHFAQVLEGEPAALDAVIASIVRDPRHHSVRVLCREPVAERRFSSWAMGYLLSTGAADLVEQVLDAGDVPLERARRLIGTLFNTSVDRLTGRA